MKTVLLILGGVALGVVGAMLWLMWYFRDVMK